MAPPSRTLFIAPSVMSSSPLTTFTKQPEGTSRSNSLRRPAHPRKFVFVPDNVNWLKYIFASDHHPTAQQVPPISPSLPHDIAFQFGVVADVQYANLATARGVKPVTIDGKTTLVRRRRAWRESILKLKSAIRTFNKADADFIVNLGDIIEGYGPSFPTRNAFDFAIALAAFKTSKTTVYHVIGNHCRNIPMRELQQRMALPQPYHSFHPAPGWRIIVLHSAELSATAVDHSPNDRALLTNIIRDEARSAHHFHGALSNTQITWLRHQLDDATAAKEHVIILSHYPLADGSARPSHVVANANAVRRVIERPNTPVVLCLAGHDHMGGRLDVPADETRSALTYMTMPAILEAPRGGNAYALVTANTDGGVTVDGSGTVPSLSVSGR